MWLLWKKEIVADYLRWYIIDRNSSVIDRFKDGLSALQFLTALKQHPSLLAPVLCHSEKRLTGFELERLFKPDLSPSGGNRRLKRKSNIGLLGRLKKVRLLYLLSSFDVCNWADITSPWFGTTATNRVPG